MKRMQKLVFSCIAMTTLLAVGRVGYAEEPAYPARPIKIVVGFPAGGANDVVARSIGLERARELHQSVVVENISGAAGTIGAATVARAQPDGYTLLMGAGAHALAPSMRKSIPYDIVKDFAPISLAAIGTYVLVVNPASKATTVEELIALAKSKPGALNMASAGVGTPLHLAGVMFQNRAGIELTHVAYRGDADANAAIVAGQVDLLFASLGPTLALIQSGKLRALAVTSLTRSAVAPDLRTIDEAGLKGYNMGTWWGHPCRRHREIIGRDGKGDLCSIDQGAVCSFGHRGEGGYPGRVRQADRLRGICLRVSREGCRHPARINADIPALRDGQVPRASSVTPARQEFHEVGDASDRVAIADVMRRRIDGLELRIGDALVHFLVVARMANFFLSGGDNQRRGLDGGQLIHEIVRRHVRHETADEGRIIRASLLNEPTDQFRIGRTVKAIADRIGQKLLESDFLDPWNPRWRLAVFQTWCRTKECQCLDARAVVDRKLLGNITPGRVSDDVRAFRADQVKHLDHIADELVQ